MRSKKSTSSWGGTRDLPYAFTEQGVYMLMTVLKGELAVNQSMRIGPIVAIREREAYHTLVDELLKMPELQLA